MVIIVVVIEVVLALVVAVDVFQNIGIVTALDGTTTNIDLVRTDPRRRRGIHRQTTADTSNTVKYTSTSVFSSVRCCFHHRHRHG